jgi:hypothetical protein
MSYGLLKASNYYNKLEAWRDWKSLAVVAQRRGLEHLVLELAPMTNWGWRKIDAQTAKLRAALEQQPQVTVKEEGQ